MLKVFEYAIALCKSASPVGEHRPPFEVSKACRGQVLIWTFLSLGLLAVAFLLDRQVAKLLTLHSPGVWYSLAVYASKSGEGWIIAVTGAAVSLFLLAGGRFHASSSVFVVTSTGLLTGAVATVIRSILGRTRPDSHETQGFYGVWHDSHWIIGKYEFGAFPSGHAATVIGLAAAAWLIDRRFGILAAGYALLVSWSRIALECHHLSDTVAAGIVGVVGARLILSRIGRLDAFAAWFTSNNDKHCPKKSSCRSPIRVYRPKTPTKAKARK